VNRLHRKSDAPLGSFDLDDDETHDGVIDHPSRR
jgi:hypothetical protein